MRLGRGFLDFWFARLEAEPAAAFRVTLGFFLDLTINVVAFFDVRDDLCRTGAATSACASTIG